MSKDITSLFDLMFRDHLSDEFRATLAKRARFLADAVREGLVYSYDIGSREDTLCDQLDDKRIDNHKG